MTEQYITSKGVLPAADLEERHIWQDGETVIVHRIEWWHEGECVKSSAHAYAKQGLAGLLETEKVG